MQRSLKDNDGRNYRNGHNKKTLKSKYGNIDVAIPRDRQASFEPQLVKKREVILYKTPTISDNNLNFLISNPLN